MTTINPLALTFDAITSSTGKSHAGFTSNHCSNDEAQLWLQENKHDNEFAQSLSEAWDKHTIDGWNFSESQEFWLHRLATPETLEVDTSGIADLLDRAGEHLKFPKFTISNADGLEIKVAKASAQSKFSGSFIVASPRFGEGFYGTLKDGKFTPTRSCTDDHLALLEEFASDPEAVASAHGHRTGNCCFCSKELSTAESLAVGYGPVCADHFGLEWGNLKNN